VLDPVQLMTLLLFLTFYVPCLSTFAVMLRTLGTRKALHSVGISLVAALAIAGIARLAMQVAVNLAA
jgi:ferrous iron transport protein B